MDDGLDRLLDSLRSLGAEGEALPCESVRLVLEGARDRGWDFDSAWNAAVNRLQAPGIGGVTDMRLHSGLRGDRALIEEHRPIYRAAYERVEVQVRLGEALQPRRADVA